MKGSVMKSVRIKYKPARRGVALLISIFFLLIFSSLAVSIAAMSGNHVQISNNVRKANSALAAAQSGLEVAKLIAVKTPLPSTGSNFVTAAQADNVWNSLYAKVQSMNISGSSASLQNFAGGQRIVLSPIQYASNSGNFTISYARYTADPFKIYIQSIGADDQTSRAVGMSFKITKDAEVLSYAIASRGRMWVTGDTTIHGDIFSSWDRADISPFNMTSDSRVEGTINTVLAREDMEDHGYQMETLDEDGNPIDINGNTLGTNYDERYYGSDDEIQGYHEGINYEQNNEKSMPGMNINDYNTEEYRLMCGDIPSSSVKRTEYFPHAAGSYTTSKPGALKLTRHVYENQHFTNARLPSNRNALFKNCTFDGILYVNCSQNTTSNYNNVRFDDCTFNGTIVSNTPNALKWQHNSLYFTGSATFQNTTGLSEATILAPHFNVNLGNTNPRDGESNVLTGAIVGGIVDVRGNAEINGTIISMCDTSQWSSGYVTNIGATLDDGGSETTELGDIGVIEITPDEDQMLPSGIITPIVIKPINSTYSEGI